MSKEKNGSSCLGLFIKSWLVSFLALAAMTAAVVALGIRYMGWSAASWQDFSAWNSYPVLALMGSGLAATFIGVAFAAFIGVASAFLSSGKGKSGSRPAKARPQSNRKTTL